MGRTLTGAEALVNTLKEHDIKDVFLIPGAANLPICEALISNRINRFLFRHEQGLGHALSGYAREARKVGVGLVTSGPGAINTLTAIADAQWDSTPIIVICGQVPTSLLGTEAFQEAPIVEMSGHITKWSYQIKIPEEIPYVLDKAFTIATNGRPGPVLIDIPKDLQIHETLFPEKEIPPKADKPELTPEIHAQLKEAAQILHDAQNPLIITGQGVLLSGAVSDLRRLTEKTQIRVASTLHGLSALPSDHPLFVGMIGTHGRPVANLLAQEADVILALGMKFDDRVSGKILDSTRLADIIRIDIDSNRLNRRRGDRLTIRADLALALPVLAEQAIEKPLDNYISDSSSMTETRKMLAGDNDLTITDATNLLFENTLDTDTIVSDAGSHQMSVARYGRFRRPGSFITTGGMGTMGFALPAAIGAQIASPDRRIIAIMGDGGFQMNIQELGTIMQYQLPVKIVIYNDCGYGMIREFGVDSSLTDLTNPDFPALGATYGIEGRTVRTCYDLALACDEMLSTPRPLILDLRLPKRAASSQTPEEAAFAQTVILHSKLPHSQVLNF
ncbi:thiamine pyrophosphate-binding protein [Candidatus Daviesbacteria bacterium]|nr:thiamine pyrophosphate-binding protein [Candidatus Daviesbacteria bacterium]